MSEISEAPSSRPTYTLQNVTFTKPGQSPIQLQCLAFDLFPTDFLIAKIEPVLISLIQHLQAYFGKMDEYTDDAQVINEAGADQTHGNIEQQTILTAAPELAVIPAPKDGKGTGKHFYFHQENNQLFIGNSEYENNILSMHGDYLQHLFRAIANFLQSRTKIDIPLPAKPKDPRWLDSEDPEKYKILVEDRLNDQLGTVQSLFLEILAYVSPNFVETQQSKIALKIRKTLKEENEQQYEQERDQYLTQVIPVIQKHITENIHALMRNRTKRIRRPDVKEYQIGNRITLSGYTTLACRILPKRGGGGEREETSGMHVRLIRSRQGASIQIIGNTQGDPVDIRIQSDPEEATFTILGDRKFIINNADLGDNTSIE